MCCLDLLYVADLLLSRYIITYVEIVLVFVVVGGTGNPYFSTDTTSALRAAELGAEVILMAKNGTDGVYDKDPRKHSDAVKYESLSHQQVLEYGLEVMDSTASALCKDNNIEILVFDMNVKGNIRKAASGIKIGTKIHQ